MTDVDPAKFSGSRGWPFLGDAGVRRRAADDGFDATALDEALERAADREELLLQALRIAGVGGWELDIASGTLNWSEETYRIFGVSPDRFEPNNDSFYDLVHPDDRPVVRDNQESSSDEGRYFDAEYRIVTPAGEVRHVRSRAQVVPRGKERKNRFLGIVQDITERRLFEQALAQQQSVAQRLQADLIHISRVSAMGAMASALAHELNQPLTAILNYAAGLQKLAADVGAADAGMPAAIDAIHDNAARAGEIIRRLRAMTMRGEINRAPFELAGCIVEAVDLALTGSDIEVRYALEPGLEVDADRIQVQQVLINLVRNALESMADSADRSIAIASRSQGDMAEIIVEDRGSGIAPEILPSVFDPFMSTKTGGMGVGLAISRTIVEAHGGRLAVSSKPGEGSTFTMSLPRWTL